MAYSDTLSPGRGWRWPKPDGCPERLVHVVSALDRARDYARRAVEGVDRASCWRRPGPGMPAIGNLLMHLRGTEHQWIGVEIGGLPLDRDRDAEFAVEDGATLPELLADLDRVEAQTREVLRGLDEVDEHALFCVHYTENHVAYHAGQLCALRRLVEPGFRLYG